MKVCIGYITGAFGIKGALKVKNNTNHEDLIYKKGSIIYIDEIPYEILNVMFHKENYIITLKGYEDINLTQKFWKKDIYIDRDSLNLKAKEFLYPEILNFDIYEDNQKIGTVKEILLNKNNIFIKDESLIIPLIEKYYEDIDILNKKVYVKNVGELKL